MTSPEHRPRRGVALLVIAALGVVIWLQFVMAVVQPTIDSGRYPTSAYWVAPRLVLEGRAAELYDPEAFGRAAIELGAYFDLGLSLAVPPHILPLLPFGLLAQREAFALWTVLSLASLVAAGALLLRRLSVPGLVALTVLALVPLFQPVRHNFGFGQAYTFLLLALTVAALPHRAAMRDAMSAGIALAGAAIVKISYGAVAMAATLIGGRPRAAVVAVALTAAAVLASLAIVGVYDARVWFETLLGWRQRPETSVTAYQTLHSLFSHLFRFDATWNPQPVIHAPLLAEALWWLSAAVLGVVSVVCLRRSARSWGESGRLESAVLPISLIVPAAILVSPVAEDYHYVQTLLSFIVGGWIVSREQRPIPALALLVAALLLIGLPLPFNQQPPGGWWALLFYPRVYGAICLWLSLVLLARSTSTGRGR